MIFGAFGGHGVAFFFSGDIFLRGSRGHFSTLGGSFWELWGVILGAFGGHFGDLGGSLGDFLDVFFEGWEKNEADLVNLVHF